MFSKEQIDSMDLRTCKYSIGLIHKHYDIEKPILKYTDELDRAVIAFMQIEDRMKHLEDNAAAEALANPITPKPARPIPETGFYPKKIYDTTFKRVSTPHGVFADLSTACQELGIQRKTLISYISNRGHNWKYLDDNE